ncbi:MAG: hypothetical protein AAF328_04205 [Planctomycetota bacterium]
MPASTSPTTTSPSTPALSPTDLRVLRRDLHLHGLQIEILSGESIHLSDRMSWLQRALCTIVFLYGIALCIGMAAVSIILYWLTVRRWDNSKIESFVWFLVGSVTAASCIYWILQLWRTTVRWWVRYAVRIDRETVHIAGWHRVSKRVHIDAAWASADARFEIQAEQRHLPGVRSLVIHIGDSAINLHLRLDAEEVRELSIRLTGMGLTVEDANAARRVGQAKRPRRL